jgi:hypothetical protein
MFKKVTNMPPMQYRQEHQELKWHQKSPPNPEQSGLGGDWQ